MVAPGRKNSSSRRHSGVMALCIPKRVRDPGSTRRAYSHSGMKTASRDGDTVADTQFRGLPVNGTNLGVLNNLGVGVGQDRISRRARQRNAVILGAEMLQLVERKRIAGCRTGAGT